MSTSGDTSTLSFPDRVRNAAIPAPAQAPPPASELSSGGSSGPAAAAGVAAEGTAKAALASPAMSVLDSPNTRSIAVLCSSLHSTCSWWHRRVATRGHCERQAHRRVRHRRTHDLHDADSNSLAVFNAVFRAAQRGQGTGRIGCQCYCTRAQACNRNARTCTHAKQDAPAVPCCPAPCTRRVSPATRTTNTCERQGASEAPFTLRARTGACTVCCVMPLSIPMPMPMPMGPCPMPLFGDGFGDAVNVTMSTSRSAMRGWCMWLTTAAKYQLNCSPLFATARSSTPREHLCATMPAQLDVLNVFTNWPGMHSRIVSSTEKVWWKLPTDFGWKTWRHSRDVRRTRCVCYDCPFVPGSIPAQSRAPFAAPRATMC